MIKYLKNAGYKESRKNDLLDKQFFLTSSSFTKAPTTVMNIFRVDYVENYTLFLKRFDTSTFSNKLSDIMMNAIDDGSSVVDLEVEVNRVENGFNINLKFIHKG